MAVYGQGQMLGEGFDPRLLIQDYSGITEAARMQAQALSGLGATIGGAIKSFGEAKKENQLLEGDVKAAVKSIDSLAKLVPGMDPETIKAGLLDPDVPLRTRAAEAKSLADNITSLVNMGIQAQQLKLSANKLTPFDVPRVVNGVPVTETFYRRESTGEVFTTPEVIEGIPSVPFEEQPPSDAIPLPLGGGRIGAMERAAAQNISTSPEPSTFRIPGRGEPPMPVVPPGTEASGALLPPLSPGQEVDPAFLRLIQSEKGIEQKQKEKQLTQELKKTSEAENRLIDADRKLSSAIEKASAIEYQIPEKFFESIESAQKIVNPNQRAIKIESIAAGIEAGMGKKPERETSQQLKYRISGEALNAYRSGNVNEAVRLLNSIGGKGLMGAVTASDLPSMFPDVVPSAPASSAPADRPPLETLIPD